MNLEEHHAAEKTSHAKKLQLTWMYVDGTLASFSVNDTACTLHVSSAQVIILYYIVLAHINVYVISVLESLHGSKNFSTNHSVIYICTEKNVM